MSLKNTDSIDTVYEVVDEEGNFVEYDLNRLVFGELVKEAIPEKTSDKEQKKKPAQMYGYRMKVQDKLPDGSLQDLLIRTELSHTFGIQESTDPNGVMNGYSLPVSMWEMGAPTPSQKAFTDFMDGPFLERVKDELIEKKDIFNKFFSREDSTCRKMKCLFRKVPEENKGEPINFDTPPTWYPKLICKKTQDGYKILSPFYLEGSMTIDKKTQELIPIRLDAVNLLDRPGKVRVVVKVDSVYIGSTGPSIQFKVWEADYTPSSGGLARKAKFVAQPTIVDSLENDPMAALFMSQKIEKMKVQPQEKTEQKSDGEFVSSESSIPVIPTRQVSIKIPPKQPARK